MRYFSFIVVLYYSILLINCKLIYSQATSLTIHKSIEQLASDSDLRGATIGFYAYNLHTNQEIANFNANNLLIPASLQKLLTTITALDLLRETYRIRTDVFLDGEQKKNAFYGKMIIRGYGDPTIGSEQADFSNILDNFCNQIVYYLSQREIDTLIGEIIADARVFGPLLQPSGYTWEDLGNYYGAGASSLNFAENKIRLEFQSGKKVDELAFLISAQEHPTDIQWISSVTTASPNSGDNIYVYGVPFQKIRYITGTMPAQRNSFIVWASDPDPAIRFSHYCRQCLINKNIHFTGNISAYYYGDLSYDSSVVLMRLYSPLLQDIIKVINKKSNNIYAESIYRNLGWKFINDASWKSISNFILKYWRDRGFDISGLSIQDGSGLSITNRMTAKFISDLLIYASKQVWFTVFYESLSIAGVDGTLQNSFKGSKLENNMRAKSGTMRGIRAFAGYLKNTRDNLIAFCFIINGHNLSASQITLKIERVLVNLTD